MKRKLVLYNYWRSSSSYRVRLALAAKGVEYEYVAVNLLHGEQSSKEHVARSPTGYVPCLSIDGVPFIESVAILELLDDLYPDKPLYPNDPMERARVRALVEVVNAGIQPFQNTSVLPRVSSEGPQQRAWGAHFNERGMRVLQAMMEENAKRGVRGPFAYGDTFGAADCLLLPQVYSARRFGVDLAPFPRVLEAERAGLATDAAKKALPENQPDAPPPAK
jgi:maleylacetoacetate isomerase